MKLAEKMQKLRVDTSYKVVVVVIIRQVNVENSNIINK